MSKSQVQIKLKVTQPLCHPEERKRRRIYEGKHREILRYAQDDVLVILDLPRTFPIRRYSEDRHGRQRKVRGEICHLSFVIWICSLIIPHQ